ncbi:MAG: TonB-dependent receptor [Thermotogae bacterium]|nr:TonB-dependent receptor [Thermotogota bacterium]
MFLLLAHLVRFHVVSEDEGPVEDAFIYVRELGVRAYTDERGWAKLDLPSGRYSVVVQTLGYRLKRFRLNVRGDTSITVRVEPLTFVLGEVKVSPKTRSAYEAANPGFLEAMPFIGDQDVGYFISVAPGVVPVYGLAYFSVRGSSPFENLITYDGIPLFNAFSYYGMYTPINVDIVGGVKFLRGAFTPEVGNLSGSLIDFQSAEPDSLSGVVRVSRTNTGLALRGRGWVLSARVGIFAPLKGIKILGTLTGDVSGKYSFGNSLRGFDISFVANNAVNRYINDYRGLFYTSEIFNGGFALHGRWAADRVMLKPGLVYSVSTFQSSDSSFRLPYITDYYIFNARSRYELLKGYLNAHFGNLIAGTELQVINSHLNGVALEINDTLLAIYYLMYRYPTKVFWGNFLKYRYEDAHVLTEFGGRLDYFPKLGFRFSPSGLYKYYLNTRWAFKVQGGMYRQFFTSIFAFPPSVFYYVPVERSEILSYQIVSGVERTFPWGVGEATLFFKYYPRFTYMTTKLEEKVGRLRSFGADFWVRKESKVPLPITADISLTLMNSRILYEGDTVWYPTPWDVNITLNTSLFGYIRRNDWEVVLGGNVAFYYGRPFRGIVSHWRDPFRGEQFIIDSTHSLRLPPFARVDVFWRAPIPFKLGPLSLDVSFSVINLFPRKDVTFDPTNPDADLANLTSSYPISSIVVRGVW